ncbi:MAG: PKD domain-containing protein, partial [Candidatus Bipolaricaulia bacterium]
MGMGRLIRGSILLLLVFALPWGTGTGGQLPQRAVAINEVAWAGTAANASDEWIELYNNTDEDIDLTGWQLRSDDGSPAIALSGTIPAQEFFLLERGDDETISDISADQIYQGALRNSGEQLRLLDPEGNLVDTANAGGGDWPAGTAANGSPPYASMERIDPAAEDVGENWASNDGVRTSGHDAKGNPLNGTPKAPNSAFNLPPVAEFTFSPESPRVGQTVTFDASPSHDPDGEIFRWGWEFGDGATGEGQTVSHQYEDPGSFTVRL